MLLVSISFIINTSIFSLSLLFFFHLIKGILPFLRTCISILEKKINYTKKRMLSTGPKFIGIFVFVFVFVFCFGYVQIFHGNYICLLLSNLYQILQIQYKDMKLGGPQHILFCVCVISNHVHKDLDQGRGSQVTQ